MPGTVDVDVPAIVAGDTTVRDVRLSAAAGRRRLAGEVGRGDPAGAHAARGRRFPAYRRRYGIRRAIASGGRPALGLCRLGGQGCRRGCAPAAGGGLQGKGDADARAAEVRRHRTHSRQGEVHRRTRQPAARRRARLGDDEARRRRTRHRGPARLRFAVRHRKGRQPLRRYRSRSRGEGWPGEFRRARAPIPSIPRSGCARACWKSTGFRSAGSPAHR